MEGIDLYSWKIKSARPLSLREHQSISSQENVNKKVESGMTFPDFFDRMKLKKTLSNRGVDDGTFV